MKIAGISMTYNDDYKLKEWVDHYYEYKDELDYFIVVDNGSEDEYIHKIEEAFPEAVIIKRKTNGGCTAAYNDGIQYAMEETDSDAIVIIANDFKLLKGGLTILYNYLYGDENLGIVSSAVLNIDSTEVDSFGHKLKGMAYINCDQGKDISELSPAYKYTDLVTGGFYMAKRKFYEEVGLQDETLFMYGDELDTALRTARSCFKTGVTCETYVWHWHINESNSTGRKPASNYLIARNRIYLSRKHCGPLAILSSFWNYSLSKSLVLFFSGLLRRKPDRLEKAKYTIMGGIYGLKNDMKINEYTKF